MLPPLTVKSYEAAQTIRPSTLPNAQTTASAGARSLPFGPAARPIWVPCMPTSKKTPSSKNELRRSRAVSLPRSCCFLIFSSPPIRRTSARRASRSFTSSRISMTVTLSTFPDRLAFFEECHQAFARIVRRETGAQALAQHGERGFELHVVLRGERFEAELDRDRALRCDLGLDLEHGGVE